MRMTRVYETLLALYPADYRARFAAEMRATVEDVDGDRDEAATRGRACREVIGLVRGVAVEWTAKLTTDAAVRGRHLPDCRKMRPVGVTRADWARGL
jgi:hypothetical protein